MSSDIFVTSKYFAVPFDYAWQLLTNPLYFPDLYPNWVTSVEPLDESSYEGAGSVGDPFIIVPRLNKQFGAADFETIDIDGNIEITRSRLFPVERGCLMVYLVVRNEVIHLAEAFQVDHDLFWKIYMQNLQHDLSRAKLVVEKLYKTQRLKAAV